MIWPFRKKPRDLRIWNEDWQIGDTAECILRPADWASGVPPWCRPEFRQQLVVTGFVDATGEAYGDRHYFLWLKGWPVALPTRAFRKVRSVAKSEIVERILKAKPGKDRVREVS